MLCKTIDLDKDKEPDIYNAIKRDALLENVNVSPEGIVDYFDTSVTQNTGYHTLYIILIIL